MRPDAFSVSVLEPIQCAQGIGYGDVLHEGLDGEGWSERSKCEEPRKLLFHPLEVILRGNAFPEVQDVIHEANCGYAVNAGDWQGLAESVKRFLEQRDSVSFGENARKYYESHFAKGRMIDKLEYELEAACGDLATV